MTVSLKPAKHYVRFGIGKAYPSRRPWCVFGVLADGTKDTIRDYSSEMAAVAFIEGMSYAEDGKIPKHLQRGM